MVALDFAATLAVRCVCDCLILENAYAQTQRCDMYCLKLGNLFSVAAVFDGDGP